MAEVKKASFAKLAGLLDGELTPDDVLRGEEPSKQKLRSWRVEATVPATQWVEAETEEEAIKLACATPSGWSVDSNAPIDAEHVVEVEAEDE